MEVLKRFVWKKYIQAPIQYAEQQPLKYYASVQKLL